MTVALQIRDVPEEVRDVIAAQAAARGQSMQVYLLDLVNREAPELDPVAIIREGRDGGFDTDRGE